MHGVGALASLALVVGIGVWGYKLVARDVSGVPVVRAAEGPMRVQPDDPGGKPALNQGLSVNQVAAGKPADDAPERVVLAPAPLDLDAGTAQADAQPAAEPAVADAEDQRAAVLALAEELSEGAMPLSESPEADEASGAEATRADAEPTAPAQQNTATEADSDAAAGLGRSLRPKLRPAALKSVTHTAAASGPRDVDPENIPAGTRLAQLGAFESAEVARDEWRRISDEFASVLSDKDRVIQRAESGGRIFYRLRAMGFEDLADARRFCSALVSEGAECIPVVTR
ncbi:SPOR domain-containing protein [Roseovarius salinarum]|uniref:SPOR domain-containing protein n=1 Tax=Roseovarius salinarum TaxID=1981892 RepID=UPI001E2FA28A|nr:SPOR domain-containing protein [Roseovarius salinarum]